MSSRTSNSIRNSYTALFYNVVTIVFGFFSRKIFIDTLGAEVLGLNTTASNLLNFLNLAELGIGSAVAFTLYMPIAKDDKETISEIIAVQGWLYRRIAYLVLGGSAILFCFFPFIFAKIELPLWYAYASFIVLLFSSLLGYFVNYKQIILSASQQEYKINHSVQGVKIVKVIIQIVGLYFLQWGYIFWLCLEVIATFLTALLLNYVVRRDFPWLKNRIKEGHLLIKKHTLVISKIKQVFFHKIGGFALGQTTPLVIYAYLSLTMVAVYGNYMLVIGGIILLNNALNNGLGAGVGNLISEGNQDRILLFFREYTAARFCFATIVSICLFFLSNSFMQIWFGGEYLLDNVTLNLIVLNCFITLTRTNDAFISGYGLFGDIWAPLIEAILNVGLSILLGHYFGLPGILTGVLISLFIVIVCWKPYYLFAKGFCLPIRIYVIIFLKNNVLVLLSVAICYLLNSYVSNEPTTITHWCILAVKTFILCSVVIISIFQLLSADFRIFSKRVINIINEYSKKDKV